MVFTSFAYLGFLVLTAALYFLVPKRFRWILLLLASLGFYLAAGPAFLAYLAFTTLTVWLTALALGRGQDRLRLRLKEQPLSREQRQAARRQNTRRASLAIALCLVLNLGVLFVLKYLGLSLRLLGALSGGHLRLTAPALLLPIGISFYTFQAIGYLLDVHRGVAAAEKNPLRILLFLSFFPSILQGPINRYSELAPQLAEGASFDSARFARGAQRILWGFFEKLVIADRLGLLVDGVFSDLGAHGGFQLVVCIVLYAFQIYADFQGYMDIALGSAELFGITLPENFRVPYLSGSVPAFWRRWHITLGAWFRDYLYYPVMRSRLFDRLRKKTRCTRAAKPADRLMTVAALLLVWTATGLWHGARTTYLLWGLYYGVLIALSTLLTPPLDRLAARVHWSKKSLSARLFGIGKTFLLVLLGYVFFRAESLHQIGDFLTALLHPPAAQSALPLSAPDRWVAGVSLLLFVAVDLAHLRAHCVRDLIARQWLPLRWLVWLALLCAIVVFGIYGPGYDAASFLYFKH